MRVTVLVAGCGDASGCSESQQRFELRRNLSLDRRVEYFITIADASEIFYLVHLPFTQVNNTQLPMPYVDLLSANDYASIWYKTNSRHGNVGSFDPDKPTVVILHPMFLDTTWLDSQFGDPRLNTAFNIIAFDMRVCGKSFSRPSSLHDSWVEAADLAFAHQALQLPPVHIFALESLSTNCALRFATLFPDLCLSLTLCNVPPPTELSWAFTAYDEILQAWCFSEDLQSFEHAAMEATAFIIGSDCDPDLQDDLIAYWETEMPPCRRQRIVEAVNVLMNRTPIKPHALASITQPVLIVQGERSETCPLKYAEKLAAELVNAEGGGAILYTVKGASGCLSIVPSNASIINKVFLKFISRLSSRPKLDIEPPVISLKDRMQTALWKLSELIGDPTVVARDPQCSLSFSAVTPEVSKSQSDALKYYGKGQARAFSPLRPDGRPFRKFSERKQEHWFHGERDGISYAGMQLGRNRPKPETPEPERPEPLLISEPTSVRDIRMRKLVYNNGSVDKLVIKGSIKVVGNIPLQLLT